MRNRKESGITLIMGTVSLLFIIPMVGLAIDVGFLYAAKSKMQAAVDGAALAAARALSIGQSLGAQTASAQSNAVNWFYSNFPTGYFGTKNIVMGTGNVNVFNSPNNAQLRNVTVTATAQVNTFFMKWLGFDATTIGAVGNASRRTVVAMLVLDRSGSMQGTACTDLVNSSKLFVGQFAENSDYIGAVSFSDNYYLHSKPVQNFQQVLGYTNTSGTGNGSLDSIVCGGGTGTTTALSIAYNELYKMALPGALNVILLETDGLPNTMLMNFWDSATTSSGIAAGSNCTDNNAKKVSQGGFNNSAAINNRWTTMPNGWMDLGTAGSYFPAITGLVSQPYGSDPAQGTYFIMMLHPYSAVGITPPPFNVSQDTPAPGCAFNNANRTYQASGTWPPPDIAWFPGTDAFGNQMSPATGAYKSGVALTNGHLVVTGSASNTWTAYKAGVYNTVDNFGYRARTNMGQAANAGIGAITIFTIGLGGQNGDQPDPILLQRLANDPNGDNFNNPTKYLACSAEPTCISYNDQPQGKFVFSANSAVLGQAFLSIASQVLRLSK